MTMEISWPQALTPDEMLRLTDALVAGEPNLNANLANIAALLPQVLARVNWVGFYLWERASGEFVLGPFAGKPACTRIAPGRGVVGTALSRGETVVVADVTQFPGHIACDPDSRSEVVVPIHAEGRVVAGLDADSPEPGRFTAADVRLLEAVAGRLGAVWNRCRWYA